MNDYGKLPPQNIDLEKAILGAVMLEKTAANEAMSIITSPEYFYLPAHADIWAAIETLYRKERPIDSLTVCEQLKESGKLESSGGPYYLAILTNTVGSSAHIEYHATIVKESYLRRRMITECTETIKDCYDEGNDVLDTYDSLVSKIDSINRDINRASCKSFFDTFVEKERAMKEAANTKEYTIGIKTHLHDVDRVTMGLQKGDLIIVAARPSMGKTAFAVDIARKQASTGIPVGIISLEMSSNQLMDRIIASELQIPLEQVRKGGLTGQQWELFELGKNHIANLPIHISDKGGLTLNEIVSTAKNWRLKFNIEVLYIDYLQMIGNESKNKGREQEVSGISRRLKQLAKEMDIPVVALAQLSRACETRNDKRPMLSDLRDSGAIEQDADMVIFPFRPEYYDQGAEKGLCEVDFAKNRNGKVGKVNLTFSGDLQRFYNYVHNDMSEDSFF